MIAKADVPQASVSVSSNEENIYTAAQGHSTSLYGVVPNQAAGHNAQSDMTTMQPDYRDEINKQYELSQAVGQVLPQAHDSAGSTEHAVDGPPEQLQTANR